MPGKTGPSSRDSRVVRTSSTSPLTIHILKEWDSWNSSFQGSMILGFQLHLLAEFCRRGPPCWVSPGEDPPFKPRIEIAEAVVFANQRPVLGQLVFHMIRWTALIGDLFSGFNRKAFLALVTHSEFGQQIPTEEHRHSLGPLLGGQGKGALRQLSCGDHQQDLFRTEGRGGAKLDYRGIDRAGNIHVKIITELFGCGGNLEWRGVGILA